MTKRVTKAVTVFNLFWQHIKLMFLTRQAHFEAIEMPAVPQSLTKQRRSLFIRHLDCGSCNGCELELTALSNPVYDMEQYGIRFEASPRHANVLVMTGPFTCNLEEAAHLTLEAMPEPKIIAIGDCAINGGVFKDSYAINRDSRQELEKFIVARVPGCPPTPEDILKGLLELD